MVENSAASHKENLAEKYNDLPMLAKWKALILEYGVDLEKDSTFSQLPGIEDFKTKRRIKDPTVDNFRFKDTSTDNFLIASELILTDKTKEKQSLVKVGYKPNSPLVASTENGELHLYERDTQEVIPVGVDMVKNRQFSKARLPVEIDNKQPRLEDFVQVVGMDRIGVLAYEGCWHWITSKACQFCDANPKREGDASAMPTLNTLKDFKFDQDEWWNRLGPSYLKGIEYAFQYVLENEQIEPHKHLQLMAGNMIFTEKVWEICGQIADVLNSVNPVSNLDSYLNISAPKKDVEKQLRDAKERMGFSQIAFNLEVWGKDRFAEACPGKSGSIGFENTVAALEAAVPIFGKGNVRSNFVLGAQPIPELMEGVQILATKGIVADYSVFVPKRGTGWENKARPEMEDVVDFTKNLAKVYRQHNFKSIYCGLSSRSNIVAEVLEE
jgi:hypothetical protein